MKYIIIFVPIEIILVILCFLSTISGRFLLFLGEKLLRLIEKMPS